MTAAAQSVLLSIKPYYADLIFRGDKRAELRKRVVAPMHNMNVYVYVTSPVKQIRGGFRVACVLEGPPEYIWKHVGHEAHVNRQDFNAYYAGQSVARALKIENVWEYISPIELDVLQCHLPNFSVPQSWRYVKPEEYRFLNA